MEPSNIACSHCKRTLPDYLTSPLVTSDGSTGAVCAVCGLYLSNQALGIERTHFQGEIAEDMRLGALEHYEQTNQEYEYE